MLVDSCGINHGWDGMNTAKQRDANHTNFRECIFDL